MTEQIINTYNFTYFGDLNTKWTIGIDPSIIKRDYKSKWRFIVTSSAFYMASGTGTAQNRTFITDSLKSASFQIGDTLKKGFILATLGQYNTNLIQNSSETYKSPSLVIDELPNYLSVYYIDTNDPSVEPITLIAPTFSFRFEEIV